MKSRGSESRSEKQILGKHFIENKLVLYDGEFCPHTFSTYAQAVKVLAPSADARPGRLSTLQYFGTFLVMVPSCMCVSVVVETVPDTKMSKSCEAVHPMISKQIEKIFKLNVKHSVIVPRATSENNNSQESFYLL